jgi:hypothetical protein
MKFHHFENELSMSIGFYGLNQREITIKKKRLNRACHLGLKGK